MIIPTNKVIVILYLVVFALIIPAQAADLSQFEATCLDIGFKKKTEAFGDCVIELVSREKQTQSSVQANKKNNVKQQNESNTDNYKKERIQKFKADVSTTNKFQPEISNSTKRQTKTNNNNTNNKLKTDYNKDKKESPEHEYQISLLKAIHPDWEELASSDDFAKWQKTLSPNEQNLMNNSWDGKKIAEYITQFKNWKENEKLSLQSARFNTKPLTLDQIREKHPEYQGVSDADMFDYLHEEYYKDIPRTEFAKSIGYEDPATTPGTARNIGLAFDKNVVGVGGVVGDVLERTGKMDINMWFLQLLAYALPSTILMYVFGALLIYKIRLTIATKIVGFFVAWLVTVITALLMADKKTVLSAQLEMFPAAAIGVIVALFVVSVAGRRTPSTR